MYKLKAKLKAGTIFITNSRKTTDLVRIATNLKAVSWVIEHGGSIILDMQETCQPR
jgi:hypothetical protein